MIEDAILSAIRTRLRADSPLVGLVNRTQDIEISREGRPNPLCGPRFCGLFIPSSTNANPMQMSGVRMSYDVSVVLTRKIEAKPKDRDRDYMYEDGSAMPKIEMRIVRLLHQSTPTRELILDETATSYPDLHIAFDGGIEYHGPRTGIEFKQAEWFFGDTDYPGEEQLQQRPGTFRPKDKGPDVSREFYGLTHSLLFRLRALVAHRHFRLP